MAKISLNLNEEVAEKSSKIPKMSHSLTSFPIVNLFTFVRSHSQEVTERGSCLQKSVNSLLKKSLNLSKLFEPTLNMKINVHVVQVFLFMVHFTKIVMSLPCQQLTTKQCKEVSRMVQLRCNPKLTKVLFQSSPDR